MDVHTPDVENVWIPPFYCCPFTYLAHQEVSNKLGE